MIENHCFQRKAQRKIPKRLIAKIPRQAQSPEQKSKERPRTKMPKRLREKITRQAQSKNPKTGPEIQLETT
jgi:hypothetical protein